MYAWCQCFDDPLRPRKTHVSGTICSLRLRPLTLYSRTFRVIFSPTSEQRVAARLPSAKMNQYRYRGI